MRMHVVGRVLLLSVVQAGRSKRQRAMALAPLEPGDSISAKVVLAKPDSKWAVATSTDGQGRLFVVQVADFHCPHRTCLDAELCFDADAPVEAKEQDSAASASTLSEGKEFVAKVGESFTPGLEGYWEGQEDGVGASGCNPYAGAVLAVEDGAGCTGKRKVGVDVVLGYGVHDFLSPLEVDAALVYVFVCISLTTVIYAVFPRRLDGDLVGKALTWAARTLPLLLLLLRPMELARTLA